MRCGEYTREKEKEFWDKVMESLEEFIEKTKDGRELKRALSAKMKESGLSGTTISELLQVSPQFVSKWQQVYEAEGVERLYLRYKGSRGYLSKEEEESILSWIRDHSTLTVEDLITYVEETYGVLYQSRQSYYVLLRAGGLSYHKTEKVNPQRDELQVLAQQELVKKNWRSNGMPSNEAR
jgi:transposase